QAMFDRVFHQGLQHHRWEDGRFQTFRNVHYWLQAPFHSHRHDLQEGAAKIDLLAQCGTPAFAHLRHGGAQAADQALLHLGGARGNGLDKLVDAGQCIEEEVRLDLRLQRFHARFEHAPLELFSLGSSGGLGGDPFRSALAARHHLDDDGDDDEQEYWSGCLNIAASTSSRNETSSSAFHEIAASQSKKDHHV